ncbi:potassium channel family protein [Salisaeta longa]|uniref:potassium channel family protein n=1 Tax=Salisaeta longa TaxID=503170 RepID=UPI0003B6ABA0|nr:TrkA family potassium uptake protein [Salisaeta longa]
MKRFVIVGIGNFGSSAAEALYSRGHDVIAVDTRESAVDQVASHVSRAAVGDGRKRDMLRQVGADASDAAVISTGDDITASILSTMALKDLGVEEIYVKVISHDHARVMSQLGVTETVFPERESAFNLANRISEQGILNYVRMSGDLSIQEMVVLDTWVGESLRALELRARFGISVIAVHDVERDVMDVPPDPDAPLKESDTLLLAGRPESLAQLADAVDEDAS